MPVVNHDTIMKLISTLLSLVSVIVISCKDGGKQSYLPSSIGSINSITVVIDNDLWKGAVGDSVRQQFASPAIGLTWDEPLFTLNQLPEKVFTGSIRNSRTIIYIKKDTSNLAHIKQDMYATPQRVAVIKGATEEEIIANIKAKAPEIIKTFQQLELKETQDRFLKSLNKEKALTDKFNIRLNIPSVYKVGAQQDNFVWIDRQIPKGHANVIAYTMPGDSFSNDSTLVTDIVRMRDSIGAKYVPGDDVPGKVTHMRTEPAFAPSVFTTEIAGRKAYEVRGVWDVKNDFMAGPFLTYIIDDPKNNRKMILEGFTYAPATDKRDDMFQLEAIMKTVKFLE
ncbi:MAG: DUF4837 family protein [Flavobacteriaceae bacterium]